MFLSEKEKSETIWACRFCMMCQVADRVGEVVCHESYTPRGRGAIINALEKGLLKWDEDVAEILYSSLNDGRLQEWCVGNYDHEELVLDVRAELFEKGFLPSELIQFIDKLDNKQKRDRTGLIAALQKEGIALDHDADTILYIGCSSQGMEKTIIHFGQLLNKAGVPFKILEDELCCGHSHYQAGDLEGAASLSKSITEAFKSARAGNVIVMDADCFRMFTTRSSRFGGDVQGITFAHCTMILDDLLQEKRIPLTAQLSGLAVTYQDPCSLTRYCNKEEAPRRVLSAIGVSLNEMDPNRKNGFCCGAGGLLSEHKPEVALNVAKLRCREASETEADMLITACGGCHTMLQKGAKESEGFNVPTVTHIIDLVAMAAGL